MKETWRRKMIRQMIHIMAKCHTLSDIEQHVENYVSLGGGEASREFYVSLFWETYHLIFS